jgi:GT2 family glycosyltransferase
VLKQTDESASQAESRPDVSVLIVSFNTRDVLNECLRSLEAVRQDLSLEVIVVDNASRDGSVAMLQARYPQVKVIASPVNLGFGRANNRAYQEASGRYIVLLNSDAFLHPDALAVSIQKMEQHPLVGLGGGQLLSRDGALQPSARMFPSLLNHLLVMSGLSDKFPKSRFFGRPDRTWADPLHDAEVEWVPGAYSIIRNEAIRSVGFFDPAFFLYYEEVDLCKRIRQAGWKVMYWPDIRVVHIGGESSRQVGTLEMSSTGAQLVLWRMRSTLLYFRKHGGVKSIMIRWLEVLWYRARAFRNSSWSNPPATKKAESLRRLAELMQQAWHETGGGRFSPPHPW